MRRRYRLWKARRRPCDRCETCGRMLRRSQAVEITETITVDDLGGTALTAVYCKAHAPKGLS